MNEEKWELLSRWSKDLKDRKSVQYLSASHCKNRANFLGIVVIIASTIVSSSLFTSLSSSDENSYWMKVFLGVISTISVATASAQSLLKYSERADAHLAANRLFGRLLRRIEFLLATSHTDEKELDSSIKSLQRKIDDAIENSLPGIRSIWDIIRNRKQQKKS